MKTKFAYIISFALLLALTACAPKKAKEAEKIPAKELKIVDPRMATASSPPSQSLKSWGSVWVETQTSGAKNESRFFVRAAVHKPTDKNIFLDGSLAGDVKIVEKDDHDHGDEADHGKKGEDLHDGKHGKKHDEKTSKPEKQKKPEKTKKPKKPAAPVAKKKDHGHDH